jgi:hypothetical protein
MDQRAAALRDYMSDLSEQGYYAGWMMGLEYALWDAVESGPFRYGHLDLTAEHVRCLRELSAACGGWVRYDDVGDEVFVPLPEWRRLAAARGAVEGGSDDGSRPAG